MADLKLDEIGYWSEIKLDIVKKYAQAYSVIISKQQYIKKHVYIDAFAGAGQHISKATKEFISGSPLNALNVEPPFKEYHFIDINQTRVEALKEISKDNPNSVFVYEGDCNNILIENIFPRVRYDDYRRGLCLLDPYGLHLDWEVIRKAGEMKSIEIFLNFPVMDMNMNVLWTSQANVDKKQLERMNKFWGDDSWQNVAYETTRDLFGDTHVSKTDNKTVAEAFRKRLKDVAGFAQVPEPMPMRNTRGGTVYYLFFASQKPVAADIVKDIFDTYRRKGL